MAPFFRINEAAAITFKSSGGSAAITLANLANGSYRQSVKADFGASRARRYAVTVDLVFAATPTDGNYCDLWFNPSSSGTAATDNRGGCSGADAAYTGYSSNASAGVMHMIPLGSFRTTAQATATIQKATLSANFVVPLQYGSIVLLNGSGAAIHSSDADCVVTLWPLEDVSENS